MNNVIRMLVILSCPWTTIASGGESPKVPLFRITDIRPNSVAERSQLQVGDILLAIDDRSFDAPESLRDYLKPRKDYRFRILRDGEERLLWIDKQAESFGFGFLPMDELDMRLMGLGGNDFDWPFTPTDVEAMTIRKVSERPGPARGDLSEVSTAIKTLNREEALALLPFLLAANRAYRPGIYIGYPNRSLDITLRDGRSLRIFYHDGTCLEFTVEGQGCVYSEQLGQLLQILEHGVRLRFVRLRVQEGGEFDIQSTIVMNVSYPGGREVRFDGKNTYKVRIEVSPERTVKVVVLVGASNLSRRTLVYENDANPDADKDKRVYEIPLNEKPQLMDQDGFVTTFDDENGETLMIILEAEADPVYAVRA